LIKQTPNIWEDSSVGTQGGGGANPGVGDVTPGAAGMAAGTSGVMPETGGTSTPTGVLDYSSMGEYGSLQELTDDLWLQVAKEHWMEMTRVSRSKGEWYEDNRFSPFVMLVATRGYATTWPGQPTRNLPPRPSGEIYIQWELFYDNEVASGYRFTTGGYV